MFGFVPGFFELKRLVGEQIVQRQIARAADTPGQGVGCDRHVRRDDAKARTDNAHQLRAVRGNFIEVGSVERRLRRRVETPTEMFRRRRQRGEDCGVLRLRPMKTTGPIADPSLWQRYDEAVALFRERDSRPQKHALGGGQQRARGDTRRIGGVIRTKIVHGEFPAGRQKKTAGRGASAVGNRCGADRRYGVLVPGDISAVSCSVFASLPRLEPNSKP